MADENHDLLVERDGHVLVLTMNRPERFNALSGAMLIRMFDAYEEASNDPEIRCIVVTGAGGNFCAGADLRAMAGDAKDGDPMDTQARMAEDPDIVYKALFRHYRPTKPIVAAVEGVAIAGGTELLQAMEIRVAGESARFGVSEARWSLYPMGGSAVRLPRQIPYTQAAEILLTGKHLARQGDGVGQRGGRQRSPVDCGDHANAARMRRHGTRRRPPPRVGVRPGRLREQRREGGPEGLRGEAHAELHRHLIPR
jgi:enoyl-CoA hydratase